MHRDGAAYFLKLSGVGKSTHRKGTAAAHYRYISRLSAIGDCGGYLIPQDWVDAQIYFHQREAAIRKNGNVAHKIIVNLPYSLTSDQRSDLVRGFCEEISAERAPYVWFVHTDTPAPHAHIMYVDADHETGKRVFALTDSGGLYKLRKVWESAVNKALLDAGVAHRISRWGKHSRHHHELNSQPYRQTMSAENAANVVPFPAPTRETLNVETALRVAVRADTELATLQRAFERVTELQGKRMNFKQRLQENQDRQRQTMAELEQALGVYGPALQRLKRMKGIKATIARWFSKHARAEFKAAKAVEASVRHTLTVKTNDTARYRAQAEQLRHEEVSIENDLKECNRFLAAYGTVREMQTHQKELEATRKEALSHLTEANLYMAHTHGKLDAERYGRLVHAMGKGHGAGY